jgi:hypothetical protein
MKNTQYITIIALCLLIGTITGAVHAYGTPESLAEAGKVYVSNVTYNPEVFFTGDTGTVSFEVTNGNTDQGIVVNHATYTDKQINLISGSYDYSSNIGPGKTRTFPFTIVTDVPDGTYYPVFSLSFRDADSLYHRAMVKVDNTPLELTDLNQPDAFTQGKKDTITLKVANPRQIEVKNVMLEVSGPGATVTPSKIFIGSLASGAGRSVNFTVTPDQQTSLTLTVKYNNGDNIHKVTMDLPVVFGTAKKKANPVVSNIQVKSDAGIYHITGDVTNAGLETANAVMVTTLSPAVPMDPYRTYVVGALKPDDFGSFEVTFSSENGASIPLELSYKDADGNIVTSTYDVKISLASSATEKGGLPILPIAAVVILAVVFAAGWAYYLRRNKK